MQANKAKNLDNGIGLANVARQHFENVVHINPDLEEAVKARKMIASIDAQIATFR
jgi:hypothetical protein